MKVRGHNLLWGMANPEWLGNKPASKYTKFIWSTTGGHSRQSHSDRNGPLPRESIPASLSGGMSLTKLWDGTINLIRTALSGPTLALIQIEPITCVLPFERRGQPIPMLSYV